MASNNRSLAARELRCRLGLGSCETASDGEECTYVLLVYKEESTKFRAAFWRRRTDGRFGVGNPDEGREMDWLERLAAERRATDPDYAEIEARIEAEDGGYEVELVGDASGTPLVPPSS